jgi:lipoprotein-anchoring transpeptidase ErfK/SrfK
VLLAAGVVGCANKTEGAAPADAPADNAASSDATEEEAPDALAVQAAERAARLDLARAAYDSGAWEGGDLYAASIRTSVMNVPAWPEETDGGGPPPADGTEDREGGPYRLGYFRHGSHVPFFPEPVPNDDCPEGWYELLSGGFVCGKYTSPDPKAPSVKFAANPPNLAEAMPYKYGYAVVDNTPVYRRVLSIKDRQKYEPELIPVLDAGAPSEEAGAPSSDDTETTPVASASASVTAPEETVPEHGKKRAPPKDAGVIKLGDLKGRGVLVRRMKKGFYVALDRAFNAAHARWWRTSEGFAIPFEKIALQSWTPDFHGSWVKVADSASLDAGGRGGSPLGSPPTEAGEVPEGNGTAALVNSGVAARYAMNDKGRMAFVGTLAKWTALELAEDPKTVDGVVFDPTTSGFWVRHMDLMIATPEPPSDLGEDEKWIDVDLGRQYLVAFEGKHPVFATRVSSGRRFPWDPTHDHPTPTGTYRIYEKHVSTTMDGDVAADGPYSIEDVPWVMYFQGSYALHGAFWHNLFGTTRSHGCVNMSPIDARELFFWVEPELPKGWHGVFQTAGHPGTRVVIHEPRRAVSSAPPAPRLAGKAGGT